MSQSARKPRTEGHPGRVPSSSGSDVWEEPALGAPFEADEGTHPTRLTSLEPALAGMDRSGLPSYADLYRRHRRATSALSMWSVVGAAALAGGPVAVLGAFVAQMFGAPASLVGIVVVVAVGPVLEEALKVSGVLFLAEQRPWLVPAAWTLIVAAIGSGLVFACIENLLYLQVYIPNPSPGLITWRWAAGPALHGAASAIAGLGVAKMWSRIHECGEPPDLRVAAPWLAAAALVHAAYNACVVLLQAFGPILT